jgi:hypothetical protein
MNENTTMKVSVRRVLRSLVVVVGLTGCGATEPEAASSLDPAVRARHRQIELEQRALEQRRLQLQGQVLAELRRLRNQRQASTAGAEETGDEGAGEEDKLMVFGGTSHEVFIGCLCEEKETESVFNMLGEYGSDSSATSLRNKFSLYGSNHDDTSACNPKAKRPPTVVTSKGKSLGLLTMNPALKKRISAPAVTGWLARMCGE